MEESQSLSGEDTLERLRGLRRDLQHDQAMQRQTVDTSDLPPQLALLRAWQAQRLAETYADFMTDPRYQPVCAFFLSDIYAPRDFSQRDHDLERAYEILSRIFPKPIMRLLADTVELNTLTQTLDAALLHALVEDLGLTDAITPALYAEGYRVCDNYRQRAYQIDLIARVARNVDEGARLSGVGLVLKLARTPVEQAGWREAYVFLERGYGVLKHTRSIEPFVQAIERREKRILDRIFAGDPQPFDLEETVQASAG